MFPTSCLLQDRQSSSSPLTTPVGKSCRFSRTDHHQRAVAEWDTALLRGARPHEAALDLPTQTRTRRSHHQDQRLGVEPRTPRIPLTQAQISEGMGTTQSAIARLEGGGTKPTLQTPENLAAAAGLDLVIAIGPALADNRTVQGLVKTNSAIVRRAKS